MKNERKKLECNRTVLKFGNGYSFKDKEKFILKRSDEAELDVYERGNVPGGINYLGSINLEEIEDKVKCDCPFPICMLDEK